MITVDKPLGPEAQITVKSVEDQPATISWHGQTNQYNLAEILRFKDDMEEATSTHAAKQNYWETIAAEISTKVSEFEEIGYAKWFAHARRYARLAMKSLDVKETLESLRDWVILLFGEDLPDLDRETYVRSAFRGWQIERLGSSIKADVYLSKPPLDVGFDVFRQNMLGYLVSGWTYEKVQKTLRDMKDQQEKVRIFAKSMNERSFKMKAYQDIVLAKHGNVSPFPVDAMRRSNQQPEWNHFNSDITTSEGNLIRGLSEQRNNKEKQNVP